MNRINLLYKLDDLLTVCNTCDRKGEAYGKHDVCKGCGTYSQILEVGKQLETKKERKPVTQKLVLEKESYLKLKGQGKSDADIAKQFGIKQPTLIYYKKKWEKKAAQAEKPAAKHSEPVETEAKPSHTQKQPDTAVVKAPEPKPIGEAINETLNEAFAEKSAEYERLIAALRNDLNEAHQQLDQKDEQIRNLEHLHAAFEDTENELMEVRQEKEELERKVCLLQKTDKETKANYLDLWNKKIKPLEEENQAMRLLIKKWA